MKSEIFNKYVEKVSSLFSITVDEFFSKSKKREIVDARQLVFYLCHQRLMKITYIKDYMLKSGLDIHHSTIIHGINAIKDKIDMDGDYISIINRIEKSVFI